MLDKFVYESWERFFDSTSVLSNRKAQLANSQQELSDLRAIVNALESTRKGITDGILQPVRTNIGELDLKIGGYQNMIKQLVTETRETIIEYYSTVEEVKDFDPFDFNPESELDRAIRIRRY